MNIVECGTPYHEQHTTGEGQDTRQDELKVALMAMIIVSIVTPLVLYHHYYYLILCRLYVISQFTHLSDSVGRPWAAESTQLGE